MRRAGLQEHSSRLDTRFQKNNVGIRTNRAVTWLHSSHDYRMPNNFSLLDFLLSRFIFSTKGWLDFRIPNFQIGWSEDGGLAERNSVAAGRYHRSAAAVSCSRHHSPWRFRGEFQGWSNCNRYNIIHAVTFGRTMCVSQRASHQICISKWETETHWCITGLNSWLLDCVPVDISIDWL